MYRSESGSADDECVVSVAAAIKQLREGRPIILLDDADREGEGDLAFAAKHCTKEHVNLALTIARGILCIAMSQDTAQRLNITRLEANRIDKFGTPFGMPISIVSPNSAVSAEGRAATILGTASNDMSENDFCRPGHVATLIGEAGGLAVRNGHTEGILDLLSLAGVDGPGVLCEVLSAQGSIASMTEIQDLADEHKFPIVSIPDIMAFSHAS